VLFYAQLRYLSLNTLGVTALNALCSGCGSIEYININTASTVNIAEIFKYINMTVLPLIDTSNVKNFYG
jgi:hypothetical protein